ncbi:hypothetical protein A3L09_10120 [Thermococcus profundus]|uniref:Glycosyl transferase n=1 Tax=Thermococcus profundus TaxID=49899 RepID=A0A2Z2MCK8_THEPR|nr:glycosyltransferase family 4 protein [Thermococcus profundus]ASJ03586.1 hypothetical protein A3L09_10120 [Thermococcus profundus]
MHIYIVYNYDYYNPRNGGGIRYTHNLIRYLLKRDLDVTLIGVHLPNINKTAFYKSGPSTIYVARNSDSALKFFINLFLKVPFLKFKENSIIHAHRSYFLLPFILFHPRVPKVVTLHMKPLEFVRVEYPRYFKLVDIPHKLIEFFCLDNIDAIIAINEDIKSAYEKRYPKIKGKIKVISGSGIDVDKFRPMDKEKMREKYGFEVNESVVLFVGRLEKIKNVDFLIRSFAILLRNAPNSRLVIVGRGTQQKNLANLAKDLGIEDRITFMGEVNPEKIPEVYNCADVLALPSLSEASPTVVREALACGIPVVSMNVGDVNKIITNPKLGIIVNEYNEKLFADALFETLKLVRDHPEEVKEKCREVALKRFSFETVAKSYLEVYKSLIRER